MNVPDFYEILGVDPKADRPEIERALARCQPAWSSGTRNPKTKHAYQSYLDQIPEIKRSLLGDPQARSLYDAELAAARRAERDRKLDELQRLVSLRAAKGGLTVGDRKLLRDRATGLGLSADDLDRMIQAIPPRPEPPSEPDLPPPPKNVLDPVTRKQIRVALDHIRRKDLYDALDLPHDTSAKELAAKADSERQRWMKKSQVTAEKTVWLEVVSHAQSQLLDASNRARYDATQVLEAEEFFLETARFTLQGLPRLDPGTRATLIDEAMAVGLPTERAELLLGAVCKELGVSRDAPAPAAPGKAVRYLRCRSCSGLTDFHAVVGFGPKAECRHCRAPLQWGCPVCQRERWVDEPRCPCGFPLELREPLVLHFEAAQHAFKVRDYEAAKSQLERVQELAPKHVGARKGLEKVHERLAAVDQARSGFESNMIRRQLVAARTSLGSWAALVAADDPGLRKALGQLEERWRQALEYIAKAKAMEATDPSAAQSFYRSSLAIAADLPDARDGLSRCPPAPPEALQAELIDETVRLRWVAPAPDGLGAPAYLIVRKAGAIPSNPTDGTRLAEVPTAEYLDARVQAGEVYGYAVFARRGSVISATSARSSLVEILPDVRSLRVENRMGQVGLAWDPPPGCSGVMVVRNPDRRPRSPDDGNAVANDGLQAIDRDVVDDRQYQYGVFAAYARTGGALRYAQGVFATGLPHPAIEPLAGPILRNEPNGGVHLNWLAPARGIVKVLRSTKPIPLAVGDRLAQERLDGLEGQWLQDVSSDHAFDPAPPSVGAASYTPFTVWAGTAVVGHPARFSTLADPSELRAVRVGVAGKIHLRWRWSPQGAQSILLARSGRPATGAEDPEAFVYEVSETDYSRQGYFTIQLPTGEPGPWYLSVLAVAAVNGERLVSPGLDPSARTVVPGPNPEVTVAYAIRKASFPGRPRTLQIRTEPPGSIVPPTVLVGHSRTVPLTPDDGEILCRFPEAKDGQTLPIRSNADLSRIRTRLFLDPACDPDEQSPVRFRHPEGMGTRV